MTHQYPFRKTLTGFIISLVILCLSLIAYQGLIWIASGIIWPIIVISCVLIYITYKYMEYLKENNPDKKIQDLENANSNLHKCIQELNHENIILKQNMLSPINSYNGISLSELYRGNPKYDDFSTI